ncbi:UDP-N-acetylmuramoylalanyl-D-glutamate--2,6-diaminopimelate ligase [Herbihabitans rhizosphaerae]|uniref:UDP-N-acetylmuramoyl-L-alanyl-D-glutamate--2,6-diaminopimelate ligase n=1 Tax=Herbihabitans rhizosphaerae TaxID=1872711 RepID=A0A4Q7KI11_9PSEU|nr:UDP-N-acetylmuramoyl-L-alanyl-D-glutamate--2,6-diaminopimelate ligase [Herbihabitans rhizosphaerae]RZS34799.1 UDP-N-acetylmuramoylalanyl-D-glutamate--2,6-diaminopimelate ligase [Herbihabitans rhizosphaerae]
MIAVGARVAFRDVPAKIEGKAFTAPPRPSLIEPVPLTTLVARAGARLVPAADHDPEIEVSATGATLRAQHVLPGDLFAALPGAKAHGADFAGDAIHAGAVAVLTDEAGAVRPALAAGEVPVIVHEDPRAVIGEMAAWIYGEPSLTLSVIGTTGTSGKTTTSYLIESGLAAAGHHTGLIGTVETRIGDERLASGFTTPEAPDLQALFAVMVERGVTHVPMEVSSHALKLGRVNGTRFAIGAFTNLSQDHLDFHSDMEDYFAAKSLLFDGRSTTEIVCVDTDWGRRLVTPHTITVALAGSPDVPGDWTATDLVAHPTGEQSFTVDGPDGQHFGVTLPLPGEFNVANALLAAACLTAVGVSEEHVAAGLSTVEVPGRMERVTMGQDFTAVVDYSHKPAAVAGALDAMRARTKGRVITVLGCGGDRDTGKRPMMGAEAARRSDLLVITDDNPRTEDPAEIRAAMMAGALEVPKDQRGEVIEVGNRRDAIETAVARAEPGDIVIVAGKGHETGQEIQGVVHPFSDTEELAAAIRERLEPGGSRW